MSDSSSLAPLNATPSVPLSLDNETKNVDSIPVCSLDEDDLKGNNPNFEKKVEGKPARMDDDPLLGKHANDVVKVVVNLNPKAKLTEEQKKLIGDNKRKEFSLTKRQLWHSGKWYATITGPISQDEKEYETTADPDIFIGTDSVVDYLKHHDGVEGKKPNKPPTNNNIHDQVEDKWDGEFAENLAKKAILYQAIHASHDWDISSCLHVCGCLVALKIRGKNEEEIRKDVAEQAKFSSEPVKVVDVEKKEE